MSDSKRLELHQRLVEVLGTEHAYFQPPENVKMVYPAIVYSRRTGYSTNADDRVYRFSQAYDVTYISKDPDDGFVRRFMDAFPKARYDRHYTSGNLHHDNFFIYTD